MLFLLVTSATNVSDLKRRLPMLEKCQCGWSSLLPARARESKVLTTGREKVAYRKVKSASTLVL